MRGFLILRLSAEAIRARCAGLRPEVDHDDDADDRDQGKELHPARFVDVVQTTSADGEGGDENGKREKARKNPRSADGYRPEQLQDELHDHAEQHEEPEFGPRGSPAEIGVFREAGFDGLGKAGIHDASSSLRRPPPTGIDGIPEAG